MEWRAGYKSPAPPPLCSEEALSLVCVPSNSYQVLGLKFINLILDGIINYLVSPLEWILFCACESALWGIEIQVGSLRFCCYASLFSAWQTLSRNKQCCLLTFSSRTSNGNKWKPYREYSNMYPRRISHRNKWNSTAR